MMKYESDVNVYNFTTDNLQMRFLYKSDLRISTARNLQKLSEIKQF